MPAFNSVSSKDEIGPGKIALLVSGAQDLSSVGYNAGKIIAKPARAIVASGSTVIKGTNGVNVTLPNTGGFWHWDIEFIEVISVTNPVVVIW